MGWEVTMNDKPKLLLISQEDDVVEARIWALHDLMVESPNDYVPSVLRMLMEYIGDSYEGFCIEQALFRIQEGEWWWREGVDD